MGGMMQEELTTTELIQLINRVFCPGTSEGSLAILIDLPDEALPDNFDWEIRRRTAWRWYTQLLKSRSDHNWDIRCIVYPNVRQNNADLPTKVWVLRDDPPPDSADALNPAEAVNFEDILNSIDMILAPTELSTTAPLKLLAPRLGFRAATMPGFSSAMIPALRLDYTEINRKVNDIKSLLDRASGADILFIVDEEEEVRLHLDLRFRTGHASGGLLPTPGLAGNLPSGEAYIVPYEGEVPQESSKSHGRIPVQIGNEIVSYEIEENHVIRIDGDGPEAQAEREFLDREPAYGNLAELGLGVLGDFGITPIGEILLDEKLGLHIAFGRSDHFGGQVGAADFSSPQAVIHLDRVFVPEIQPRVLPASVSLRIGDSTVALMKNGKYC